MAVEFEYEEPTEEELATVTVKFGAKDIHISHDDVPWVKYAESGIYFKPIRLDVINGRYDVVLKVEQGGVIGRHQHHGEVTAYTLEGSWYYKEYDWVAKAGDIVHEAPGGIHTLCSDEGMVTIFHVTGILEFFDDNNNYTGKQNVFWFLQQYKKHCDKHGIEFDKRLLY